MAKRKETAQELLARAEANSYQRGACRDQDSTRDGHRHINKTMKDHTVALDRYVLWTHSEMQKESLHRGLPIPDEANARLRCLREGVEAPDLATIKDFLRFHIATSRGKIVKILTADSVNTFAEWFFAGFHRITGTTIDEEDRSEVYKWVRKTLTVEGVVANIKRPKHNFSVTDLTRLLVTLWTKDNIIYDPERYRLQFTFIFRVYCWTGARLGAFFTEGLRYGDVDLILQRVPDRPWRLIYQVKQRLVKNNRDP